MSTRHVPTLTSPRRGRPAGTGVWMGYERELYFVCKVEIKVSESPGDKTVGVDLGINNFAVLACDTARSLGVNVSLSQLKRKTASWANQPLLNQAAG